MPKAKVNGFEVEFEAGITALWTAEIRFERRRRGPIRVLFRHFRSEVEARIAGYYAGRPHVQGESLFAAD